MSRLVLLLVVAFVAAACVPRWQRYEPEKPPRHDPKAERVDFRLTVLHNNDGESDLLASDDDDDPGAGTISRYGSKVKELRRQALWGDRGGHRWWHAKGPRHGVLTISAGDNFLASPEFQASLDRGIPFYDAVALDSLRYDAFVLGNHEFDFGTATLADFIRSFRGNNDVFISANLDFSLEPELQRLVDQGRIRPSVVVRERGERIAIIGVTTPNLFEVSSPGNTIVDDDLVGVIQAEADRYTKAGIDKIIVASHLQDIDNEVELVSSLRNVDAVIGGGGGEDISANYPLVGTDADGRSVPVVTVPGDYFDVGRLTLDFDRRGHVIAFGGGLEPVTSTQRQDRFILRRVENPVADFVADLDQIVVAQSEVGLNGIRAEVRSRETNVGSLLADAHRATAQAAAATAGTPEPDVGLQNGGGIRNDSIIGPGAITALDTFDIAPFSNFISVITVERDDFAAAVEHGLSALPDAEGFFGHWSGATITYDPGAEVGDRVVDLTLDSGEQIIDDSVVQAGDDITIATIDFLAAGNDGYDMFETYEFTNIATSYQQSLAGFMSDLGTITAAEYSDPVDPADRTRIIPVS